jgi:hypothetical protein
VPPLLVRITDLKKAPKKSPNLLENGSQEPTYYNVALSLSLSLSLGVKSRLLATLESRLENRNIQQHKDCKEKKFFFFNKRKKHAETH